MTRRSRNWLLAFVILLALAAALYAAAQRVLLGAQAYLFGYPLVIMDVTRDGATRTVGAPNRLQPLRKFPDAAFRAVVRPNVDTLYTIAFIDADAGPWVFTMPPNDQRYELMPFMDAWTDVFTSPGTRTVGTQGGRYLIVGPRWQSPVPEGMTLMRAPTQIVWLLGRTQTNGADDYAVVHALQDGLKLEPLNATAAPTTPAPGWQPGNSNGAPIQQMQQMATEAFFQRLAQLMVANPPRAADAPMVAQLAGMGVVAGQPVRWNAWQRFCFDAGRRVADWKVTDGLKKPKQRVRGWFTPPANMANFGTDYATRAGVAMVGLGVNLPADAVYPNTREDAKGEMLNGSHRYRIHFAADALPPVKAFWSVTAYGADDFLIDNPLNRYALGDRDTLQFNADGSLDIWVQAQAPADAKQLANWLPVRAGEAFTLNARLYWPKPEALDGRWGMPAVERLD